MNDVDVIEHDDSGESNNSKMAVIHSLAVMEQWGNGETYNEERWIERGRYAVRQTMEGMFELGRALIVLKEHTDHGRFMKIVKEEFGIGHNETARLMAATQRFATPQMQKAQAKLMDLGKSKLLELLVEEDVTLVGLADGEEVNGMTLDDVDRMTVRELRSALRSAREDTDATRKVSADKDAKINRLTEQLEKQKAAKTKEPDAADVGSNITMALASTEVAARSQISRIKPLFEELVAHGEAGGFNHRPVMVGCLNQLIADIEQLRGLFDLPDEVPQDDIEPEWMQGRE